MRYQHEFRLNAPLDQVAAFHGQSANMAAITPPPISVRIHQAPEQLADGSVMNFTLWMGPVPVNWISQIEAVSPNGFIDRQLSGPFKFWLHQHRFTALSDGITLVQDEIQAELKPHPWWGLVGLAMWLGMPVLFYFRARQTRRLLQGKGPAAA